METTTPHGCIEQLNRDLGADPGRTEGLELAFQFVIEGPAGGSFWIRAEDGAGSAGEGTVPDPIITLTMADTTFVEIFNGERDGGEAFFDGLVEVSGEHHHALNLGQLLGG